MSTKDTGGPAFPVADPFVAHQPDTVKEAIRLAEGMTLRDYFAAKAMQGMLANQHPYQASDERMFARDAYVLADAMLKARGA